MNGSLTTEEKQEWYHDLVHRLIVALRELTTQVDTTDPDELSYKKTVAEVYEIAWLFGRQFGALDRLMADPDRYTTGNAG